VLGLEDFMTIQALVKRGVYLCDIAEQLGVHPRTVRRALQRGGPPAPRRGRRESVLDPYRAQVDQLLSEGVWNAVVLLRELQAKGYAGGISILRDYVRPKRALRPSRVTVRFETEPGRQLQTDWGVQRTVIAGQDVAVHFAVSTLGYSRRFHSGEPTPRMPSILTRRWCVPSSGLAACPARCWSITRSAR
jgi:transposase